jgi:ribosome biogenesis GTPase / thiamine phosphate phosphatase
VTEHGMWIDTPGMRELAQWIDDTDEDVVFEDIAAIAAQCKFRDCKHRAEPGCAVRAAVEAGTLPAERLASFHKLAEERVIGAHKQEAASRLAETRKAKAKKYTSRPGKPD